MSKNWLTVSLLAGLSIFQANAANVPAVVKETRELWTKETQGTNLASWKKVVFSKEPAYYLTAKGATDDSDLTDGKLSSRADDTIWFDSAAVGWMGNDVNNGVKLLIDLGKVCQVDRVVIRCLAGKSQNSLKCPANFELFVSRDGKDFYPVASLQQLQTGEKSQSDFRRYFYLEENGTPYVYPFVLKTDADARYIGLKIMGASGSVFTDELAVMEATGQERESKNYNSAYSEQKQPFYTSGIIVKPRIGELVTGNNVKPPNFFLTEDMRDKNDAKKPATLVLELPDQISIIKPEKVTKQPCVVEGAPYIRWTMPLAKESGRQCTEAIYFSVARQMKKNMPAVIYAECPGVETIKSTVPIQIIKFPEIKPELKRLSINLSWMGFTNAANWSNFFDDWEKLGFNSVDCFPRYWNNSNSEARLKFLNEARARGLKVVMNESPFHVMEKPFSNKPGAEIFSQMPDGKSKNLCPSYRGEYYQKEMARVADNVRKTKPDYVFWDVECWYNGAHEAAQCSRCTTEQQASGKPMDEFLKDKGAETYKDLYDAVKKGSAGEKMPIVASYNQQAANPIYHLMIDFNRIYPQYVKQAQPSLYVSGRAQDVHNTVRNNYKLIKSKYIMPWLTAGTYGEFEPYKIEQMILESLFNGANGITYYCFTDFDTPLDFYYHAKALAEIAPYEDLIMDGEVLEPTGTNKQLTYSGIKKGNEMLLLVGNYAKAPEATVYQTPFSKVLEIKDLRSGKKLNPVTDINLEVPKSDIRLLYIKGK
ncbi:MAG: hypothetical protein WC071_08495 [Victivallaceae bacterium]